MQIFHKLEDVPAGFGPSLVSVGNFDGVHRAHAHVLGEIVQKARKSGGKAVAGTVEPHPARILKKKLHAREVHEGYNFRFGHKALGDVNVLTQLGQEMGFEVKVYSEEKLRGEPVSSSHIRKLISEGRVSRARHLLARPFCILGAPGRGRGLGSKYTVPTINLARYEELVPKDGVYITWTRVADERFDSVTNVGNRPTFGADSFAIETHLLNFHPIELTPESEVEICFLNRLRDEIKFPSVEALREHIVRDVNKARRYVRFLPRPRCLSPPLSPIPSREAGRK